MRSCRLSVQPNEMLFLWTFILCTLWRINLIWFDLKEKEGKRRRVREMEGNGKGDGRKGWKEREGKRWGDQWPHVSSTSVPQVGNWWYDSTGSYGDSVVAAAWSVQEYIKLSTGRGQWGRSPGTYILPGTSGWNTSLLPLWKTFLKVSTIKLSLILLKTLTFIINCSTCYLHFIVAIKPCL